MAIDLATKYLPYVDELFATESKKSLITNQDFDWTGAHTVKVYKISTAKMNDYDRRGIGENPSRYGPIQGLDATTEEFTLCRDRSFTFAIDKLDTDETRSALQAASALARQIREVVIPEVDIYVYAELFRHGWESYPEFLGDHNIYELITHANANLDIAEAPETGRKLIVTPEVYLMMKRCKDIIMETDISDAERKRALSV